MSLLQLLSNTLVLSQTAPYLPLSSLFALGRTSKSFKALVYNTPYVFRHLDLHQVKAAQSSIGSVDHGGQVWRNVQLDENVTEDEYELHKLPLSYLTQTQFLRRSAERHFSKASTLQYPSYCADADSGWPHYSRRLGYGDPYQ